MPWFIIFPRSAAFTCPAYIMNYEYCVRAYYGYEERDRKTTPFYFVIQRKSRGGRKRCMYVLEKFAFHAQTRTLYRTWKRRGGFIEATRPTRAARRRCTRSPGYNGYHVAYRVGIFAWPLDRFQLYLASTFVRPIIIRFYCARYYGRPIAALEELIKCTGGIAIQRIILQGVVALSGNIGGAAIDAPSSRVGRRWGLINFNSRTSSFNYTRDTSNSCKENR